MNRPNAETAARDVVLALAQRSDSLKQITLDAHGGAELPAFFSAVYSKMTAAFQDAPPH